jgi:hypothetical protein
MHDGNVRTGSSEQRERAGSSSSGPPSLMIRIAPEIEACMPQDSKPAPSLKPVPGFSDSSPPVVVTVGKRSYHLVEDASVRCASGLRNCEYTLTDDDVVMYSPDATENVDKLFDDLTVLWGEKGLKEGLNETDSMHIHVSLYDSEKRPITTTTHPFLEFFMQTIFATGEVMASWRETLPKLRLTVPPLRERIAPDDLHDKLFDLNVKPIMDERYKDVNNDERHIHVEFRSMCSFHRLTKMEFRLYVELIYEFMLTMLQLSSNLKEWENYISKPEIKIYGSGVVLEKAKDEIDAARRAGYTVVTTEPE